MRTSSIIRSWTTRARRLRICPRRTLPSLEDLSQRILSLFCSSGEQLKKFLSHLLVPVNSESKHKQIQSVDEHIQQLLLTPPFRFLSNVASDWLTVALVSPSSAFVFGKSIRHISPSIGNVFIKRQSGQSVHFNLPPKCMLVLTLEGENYICTRVW